MDATKEKYNYDIWIFDSKGNHIKIENSKNMRNAVLHGVNYPIQRRDSAS